MATAAAFARRLQVFADRTLSPAAQSAMLAAAAKRELAGLISSGRASPSYQRFVDGAENRPEAAVKPAPSGLIVYRFATLGRVGAFALEFLVRRARGLPAEYLRGFYLAADGRFIPMAAFNPDKLGAGVKELAIGNVVAFSRKVDVQLAGGKRLRFSVPPGLFDDCVAAIRSRFGNVVDAKRVYTLTFPGQHVLKRGRKRGSRVESPAIIITPRR